MKTWVYSWIAYPVIFSLAKIVGLLNKKVRDTLRLRSWKDFLSLRFNVGQPIEYWVHVASAGELEYAIPILEELGRRKKRVLVTYYSISAKRAVDQLPQKFPWVSLVVPLPHDGLGLTKEFVALVHRQGVRSLLILKYELWPGLLWECNSHGVRVYLVDALRPSWFHKRLLHKLDGILSGYPSEVSSVDHRNVKVLGDTRVERVLQRVSQVGGKLEAHISEKVLHALRQRATLVCGSMWLPDTKLLIDALRGVRDRFTLPNIVWVPHELYDHEARKTAVELKALGYITHRIDEMSDVQFDRDLSGKPLAIIVTKKGILVELYRLGQAGYVGGAFGSGVHSVWEPALTGLLVACGPRVERSPEAKVLADRDLLTIVAKPEEMTVWLERALINLDAGRIDASKNAMREIVAPHVGAAQRIVEFCERL